MTDLPRVIALVSGLLVCLALFWPGLDLRDRLLGLFFVVMAGIVIAGLVRL